jgi:hypothetical protein
VQAYPLSAISRFPCTINWQMCQPERSLDAASIFISQQHLAGAALPPTSWLILLAVVNVELHGQALPTGS